MLKSKKLQTKKLLSVFAGGMLTAGAFLTYAAPGDLADQPLSRVSSTQPNFMLVLDDSGSMDLDKMISTIAQTEHGVDVDGTTDAINELTRNTAISDEALFQLCSGYNTLTYNPNVKYEPWQSYTGRTFSAYLSSYDPSSAANSADPVSYLKKVLNAPMVDSSSGSSDLSNDIYIEWNDANDDSQYSYDSGLNNGECGPLLASYDAVAANTVTMVNANTVASTSAFGVLTDTNTGEDGKYSVADQATFTLDVAGGTGADEIYFRINMLQFSQTSPNHHKLTVYAGNDTAAPIVNGITVLEGGAPTKTDFFDPTVWDNNNNTGVLELNVYDNTDLLDNAGFDPVIQFKVQGSSAVLVFDAGTQSDGRGFSIAWRHSSLMGADTSIPYTADGVLSYHDCSGNNSCARVSDLPKTEADVSGAATQPYNTQENYANWYAFYRQRISVAKKAISDLVIANQYRMGFATINDNGIGGAPIRDIADDVDGTITTVKNDLLDKIYHSRVYTNKSSSSEDTPLIGALSNAGLYFMQDKDPATDFFGTDSTGNTPVSNTHTETGTLNKSPIFDANGAGQCQQNFTLLFSDGAWTDIPYNSYNETVHDFHTGDNGRVFGNIDNDYNDDVNESNDATLYDVYGGGAYADTVQDTLADVAMYYFANDLAPDLDNELAVDLHGEEITHQHMATFGVGLGVNGYKQSNPPNYTDAFAWWSDGDGDGDGNNDGVAVTISDLVARIDDLRHAGFNGRGGYGSAHNLEQLQQQLDNVIAEIAARVGNTAAGASFSSIELFSEQGFRYDVSYDTSTWWGDLKAFEFDVSLDNFKSESLWSAEEKLRTRLEDNSKGHSDREIITFNGTSGIPFQFPVDYSAPTSSELSTNQVTDLLTGSGLNVAADIQNYGAALVNYLRGDYTHDGSSGSYTFRDREDRYLGGLVHSRPQYVGAPSANYPDDIESSDYSAFAQDHKDRRHMVYTGGNDGMLHGFYATNFSDDQTDGGEEVFAYIPSFVSDSSLGGNLLSTYAADYQGQAYVDGTPVIADVYVDRDSLDTNFAAAQWRSYLVGGLRSGAKGIYVLDVTNPDQDHAYLPKLNAAETAANAEKIVVKEFTHPDLGYVYGQPKIAKMNNGRWAAIVPNGYNSNDGGIDGGVGGSASLFIIYLDKDQDTGDTVTDSDGDGIFNNGQSDYSIISVTSQWVHCAREGGSCDLPEAATVRYGIGDSYVTRNKLAGIFDCVNDDLDPNTTDDFGDPAVGFAKNCEYLDTNGLSDPTIVDIDTDGDVDRIYAGDLRGNLWVFNTEATGSAGAASWGTHAGNDSFGYAKPFFTSCSVTDPNTGDDVEEYDSDLYQPNTNTFGRCPPAKTQAITAAPLIRKNPLTSDDDTAPNYLVFFGTGQYLVQADKSNANTRAHHFYGIWDAGEANSHNANITTANLVKQTISTLPGAASRTIDGKIVDYDTTASPKELGWYMVLPVAKERVILSPLLIGKNLAFATLVPVPGNCNPSAGDSYLMAINPLTGGSPLDDPLGSTDDGSTPIAGIKLSSVVVGLSGIKTATGSKIVATQADSVNQDYQVITSSSTGLSGVSAGDTWGYKGRKSWSILK